MPPYVCITVVYASHASHGGYNPCICLPCLPWWVQHPVYASLASHGGYVPLYASLTSHGGCTPLYASLPTRFTVGHNLLPPYLPVSLLGFIPSPEASFFPFHCWVYTQPRGLFITRFTVGFIPSPEASHTPVSLLGLYPARKPLTTRFTVGLERKVKREGYPPTHHGVPSHHPVYMPPRTVYTPPASLPWCTLPACSRHPRGVRHGFYTSARDINSARLSPFGMCLSHPENKP